MPLDPVSAVGIALALPGIIDLCLKYADSITDKIEATKNSENQIKFRRLNIQSKLKDVKYHLSACEKLAPDELVGFQFDIEELSLSVDALKGTLELMERRPSALRWALIEKRRVENLLKSIKEAHTSFHSKLNLVLVERSAFNASKTSNSDEVVSPFPSAHDDGYEIPPPSVFIESIERRKEHVLAPTISADIERMLNDANALPGSPIKTLPIASGGFYILEERGYSDLERIQRLSIVARISDIATTLHQENPAHRQWMSERTGIAHCIGFSSNDDSKILRLLFSTSNRAKSVNSLRALLLRPRNGAARPVYTLNEKVKLAGMVATAVLNTHNYRYVHKNIRPSTILCIAEFDDGESRNSQNQPIAQPSSFPSELGRALLVGYSDARESSAGTERLGPQHVVDEIYVHKSRSHANVKLNKRHSFLHDVYSLGVCLLEIGLWESLLVPGDEKAGTWVLNVGRFPFLKRKKGVSKQDFLEEVKINFEELARYHLPRQMGQRYTNAVLECLTGLDGGPEEVSERIALDEWGRVAYQENVELGLNYIDRVLKCLSDISV